MKRSLDAVWHRANRMPRNATVEQRIDWHVAHARVCGCREMPASVRKMCEERGIRIPSRRSSPKRLRDRE
jgi:hypothetical protein